MPALSWRALRQAALAQALFLAEAPHPTVGHLYFITSVFFPGLYISALWVHQPDRAL